MFVNLEIRSSLELRNFERILWYYDLNFLFIQCYMHEMSWSIKYDLRSYVVHFYFSRLFIHNAFRYFCVWVRWIMKKVENTFPQWFWNKRA